MPDESARVSEVRAWFFRAAEDLRAATHELTADPPILGDLVFHCQQAVEKSMKGFLTWHDVTFRKTHSLEQLGEQCLTVIPMLRPLVDRVVPLTEYAWRFRYPGEPDDPSEGEAREALALAREGYATMLALLPDAVRPG
jgi:HEPN domain-containing protein